MDHLILLKLLTTLSDSKKLMDQLHEYDDADVVELLELKYEKMYQTLFSPE